MNEEEYLDSYSAPRVDPIRMGQEPRLSGPAEASSVIGDAPHSGGVDDSEGEWEDEEEEDEEGEGEEMEGVEGGEEDVGAAALRALHL